MKKRVMWLALIVISIAFTFKVRGIYSTVGTVVGIILLLLAFKNGLPFLENRFLQWIGSLSFGLYLIHQNVGYAIQYSLTNIFGNFNYLFCLATLAIVIALSHALTRIEATTKVGTLRKGR